MTDAERKDQQDAWSDLLTSRGFALFKDAVMEEIVRDFEDHVTKAISDPNAEVALTRARCAASVRLAGLRWLKLPTEHLARLKQPEPDPHAQMSRRGHGL